MKQPTNALLRALKPNAIAIIGASLAPEKRGYQLVNTLVTTKANQEYLGRILPVNPKLESLLGEECHADINGLPVVPELAIICTPAFTVADIIRQCGNKGIAMAVVLAAGFSETGEEGAKLEQDVKQAISESGVRVLGPNISGLFLQKGEVNLVGFPHINKGDITVLSQSGNVALELITQSEKEHQYGFNQYFGIGNQLDIEFADLLDCLLEDDDTSSAVAYIEGIKNAPRFLSAAKQFVQKKPLVIYKAGRTEVSQQAAKSHTGSLAGNYRVSKDLLTSAGITLVERTDDLLPMANTLSKQSIQPSGRILVLTDGGGHGAVAADLLVEANLVLAQLPESEKAHLSRDFPGLSVSNPMDLAGIADQDPRIFAQLIKVLLSSEHIDGLIWVGLFGGYHQRFDESLLANELTAVEEIIKLQKNNNKPILLQSLYEARSSQVLQCWTQAGLTLFATIEGAVRTQRGLVERAIFLSKQVPSENKDSNFLPINDSRADQPSHLLSEADARTLLSQSSVALDLHHQVASESELNALQSIFSKQQKFAMKIVSSEVAHKSDVGGVILNVEGLDAAQQAYKDIMSNCKKACPNAKLDGVMISAMSPQGAEFVVGFQRDPQFGPIIMFGLGGIFVELFQDIHFKALPLSRQDAQELIQSLQHQAFVEGFRHFPALNQPAMINLLMGVSDFIMGQPEVKSMDLNPVIAHENGITPVDVRIEMYDVEVKK